MGDDCGSQRIPDMGDADDDKKRRKVEQSSGEELNEFRANDGNDGHASKAVQ